MAIYLLEDPCCIRQVNAFHTEQKIRNNMVSRVISQNKYVISIRTHPQLIQHDFTSVIRQLFHGVTVCGLNPSVGKNSFLIHYLKKLTTRNYCRYFADVKQFIKYNIDSSDFYSCSDLLILQLTD